VIGVSAGRRALFVNGVVQSVDPDDAASGYWEAMIPEQRPSNALLLGFGGGTVARLMHRRFGPLPVTGVDESGAMLEMAVDSFGSPLPELTLVQADAFGFVHQAGERYGFIAVDLYRGNRLVRGVLALTFLKALAARLEPGGSVAYNLFRDDLLSERVARIERVFDRVLLTEVAANAVFHGRPHRRQR
jgi:spermidine synthase